MRKIIFAILLFVVVSLLSVILWRSCQKNDDVTDGSILATANTDTIFVLQIPEIPEHTNDDYRSSILLEYRFHLVKDGEKEYLKQADDTDEFAFNSFQISKTDAQSNLAPPDKRLNIFRQNGDGEIKIEGCVYFNTGAFLVFKLSGNLNKDNAWVGSGVVSFGAYFELPDEFFELYKIQWRLCTADNIKTDIDGLYDVKLTRHLPPSVNRVSNEEELETMEARSRYIQSLCPLIVRDIVRKLKEYPVELRLHYAGSVAYNSLDLTAQEERVKRRTQQIYLRDKILSDIDWDEVLFVPESFLMIDYLASIENKKDRDEIGKMFGSSFDNGWQYISSYDLAILAKIPLLFLLVYYDDWLTPERVEKLSKASTRLKLIVEAVKKYGGDAPNKLDLIMESVLTNLSDKERRDYFVQCIRLREYVKNSQHEGLRKLLPNDLPPPPGPPENMRDWVAQSGKIYRGAFVRVYNDPERGGNLLVLLDRDRLEFEFSFGEMSKETRAYVEEMLEAMAEDAAEAEKNKKTKNEF